MHERTIRQLLLPSLVVRRAARAAQAASASALAVQRDCADSDSFERKHSRADLSRRADGDPGRSRRVRDLRQMIQCRARRAGKSREDSGGDGGSASAASADLDGDGVVTPTERQDRRQEDQAEAREAQPAARGDQRRSRPGRHRDGNWRRRLGRRLLATADPRPRRAGVRRGRRRSLVCLQAQSGLRQCAPPCPPSVPQQLALCYVAAALFGAALGARGGNASRANRRRRAVAIALGALRSAPRCCSPAAAAPRRDGRRRVRRAGRRNGGRRSTGRSYRTSPTSRPAAPSPTSPSSRARSRSPGWRPTAAPR